MTKVLVLGASGQIARRAVQMLADQDTELTLLLRDAGKLADPPGHTRVVEGDVLDRSSSIRPFAARTSSTRTWPATWMCRRHGSLSR
ncbi:MAG: NAD(P)H-binding protein [Pseudonocardiaceae bacterium]